MKYIDVHCPICNGVSSNNMLAYTSILFISNKWVPIKVSVVLCLTCGMVYNDRFPSNIQEIYSNIPPLNLTHQEKNIFQVEYVKPFLVPEEMILDIGSGLDEFPRILRAEGWKTYELEPSIPLSSEFVIKKTLEDFKTDNKYCMISMREVLEHIPNPVNALKGVKDLLIDDGVVFLEVPNMERAVTVGLENWFNLLHLCHFTPNSLSKFIYRCGYELIDMVSNLGTIRVIIRPDNHSPAEAVFRIISNGERERDRILSILIKIPEFIVWGAGVQSEVIHQLVGDKVKYFVDSEVTKQGMVYCGKPVKSPKCCVKDELPIIIGSREAQDQIYTSAVKMGITPNRLVRLFE